jgi:hypothetical protein
MQGDSTLNAETMSHPIGPSVSSGTKPRLILKIRRGYSYHSFAVQGLNSACVPNVPNVPNVINVLKSEALTVPLTFLPVSSESDVARRSFARRTATQSRPVL